MDFGIEELEPHLAHRLVSEVVSEFDVKMLLERPVDSRALKRGVAGMAHGLVALTLMAKGKSIHVLDFALGFEDAWAEHGLALWKRVVAG